MNAWSIVALKDCARIVGGGTPKSDVSTYWGGEIAWATPRDLSDLDGKIISDRQAVFYEMFGRVTTYSTLGDLISKIESGKSIVGIDENLPNGFNVLKISAVSRNGFRSGELKPLPEGYMPPKAHMLKDGDLIFSRANTAELVGLACIADKAPLNTALPDKLWRLVLALDACVTEEFLKYYVAYKAETNFVDAVPQARGLRLHLNMSVNDIHDPRGLCRDVMRGKTSGWPPGNYEKVDH